MVGKGVEPKSSRIFHQCYVKCCKLQNLTPLNNVLPSANGKVLDFCVDRIKYADWPPILNALILEHIDCERLAKTVNKRAVILTNFMLTNLMEAISQLLSNTTLLTSILLEGLPLKIPYLNPFCEASFIIRDSNNSLQHLYLPRCLLGDAGCLAVCKAVRCLPNILTLDLTGCDITPVGASYIADLVKYQKIHRYSENWVHTLRYRLPELDTMAGLRRITLCGNLQLGDNGVTKLLEVLADDLWIKALDLQNCGLTEQSSEAVLQMMQSNTTLVVLDLRHNADILSESLSKVRSALRENERGIGGQVIEERFVTSLYIFRDYTEILEEQLQEEISHRQQLEELNLQLVDQMRELKQQQIRLWANGATSSGSEQSFQASSRSGDLSSSSGSTSSVPIDQNTLSYIQQAFKDIYAFIKNNQCQGQCLDEKKEPEQKQPEAITEVSEMDEFETSDRVSMVPKKAQSTHAKVTENVKVNKTTKSAHLLGDTQRTRDNVEMKPEMIERYMGDTKNSHDERILEEMIAAQKKYKKSVSDKSSPCGSATSSADTLVARPRLLNPREALYSSDDDSS
ncbi:hypothetical protein O3G_MSEX014376 [Manduca sexta]|uniref:Protein Cep78 homolog n=1 Tax=Manduca sexta TaxID=7130 RepID=A0A922CZY1_MANSE|nr:hypothetical protein O3G_MSEX014376 [Manduca sexta]KAG6464241.1 hypothetical protein O3G_MSEX014376 [Manduca sexta]